ncbi:MAG: hypothetical protein IKU35_06635 [Bacteroidaceae bacterium]|nr:hypothetical protein [Bacteroidaceae bacterium]
MQNKVIKQSIEQKSTYIDVAKALGCGRSSLYRKVNGEAPWKITELIALSRICEWTVEQFLEIIEYKEEQ